MKKVFFVFIVFFYCSNVFSQNVLDSLKLKIHISEQIVFVTDSLKKPCFTEKVHIGLKNTKEKFKSSGLILTDKPKEADTIINLKFEVENVQTLGISLIPNYNRKIGLHPNIELCKNLVGFESIPEYIFFTFFSFNDIYKDTLTKKEEALYSPVSILSKTNKNQNVIESLIINRVYNHFLAGNTHYPYLKTEKNSPVVSIHTKKEKKTGNTIFTLVFSYYGKEKKTLIYESPEKQISIQKFFILKKNFTKKEFYQVSNQINQNISKFLKINKL